MCLKLKVISTAAIEPITVIDAKKYLRIDDDEDDFVVMGLIKQAREYCEEYQGKKYINQTIEGYLDYFPSGNGNIEFRDCSPVQYVESIKYTDKDGIEHVFGQENYSLDNVSFVNQIYLNYGKSWPSTILKPQNGVKITFIAGFDSVSQIPETYKWAMILHMKLLYDDYKPEERAKLEQARDSLLNMERVIPV